jgi:two-component system cell cycle sensor histidine kinase/response regulator CckA
VARTGTAAATALQTKPGLALKAKAPKAKAQARNEERSRQTILLVEDEDFVREVACEVLLFAGYQVLAARNATEALQRFAENRKVALLLTDVALPGRSGSDLARELRTAQPGLKTILTSGYPQRQLPRAAPERGVLYLAKPFSAEALMQAVRRALEGGAALAPEVKRAKA